MGKKSRIPCDPNCKAAQFKGNQRLKQYTPENQSTDHHPSKNANTVIPVTHLNSVHPMGRHVGDAVK